MEPQTEREVTSISLSAYFRLLRVNRNFRRLWGAQIVSEIGDWFYTLAIYSLLLQLTGRASSVALALVLQVLPQTFIGPVAGVVNDRIRRKRVMIAADLGRMVIVFAMLLVRSRAIVWLVYPLLLLETLLAAFFEPARSSVVPNITEREDVILANTLSSATWSVNLLVGASIGGVVAALLGRDAVFILNALSFLASALLIRGMHFEEPHAKTSPPLRARDLGDHSPILEGVRYVHGNRRLLATMFAKAGELMIGPSWVLFTVMGQKYFPVRWHGVDAQRGGMLGMSLLLGARGLGALVGPLFSARWAGHSERRLRLGILFGYVIVAIGYGALGGTHSVWVAVPLGDSCALRRVNDLGVLYHLAATQHRGPFPRTSIFCRSRLFHVDHRDRSVSMRTFSGCGSLGKSGGDHYGLGDVGTGRSLGMDRPAVAAYIEFVET